MKQNVINNFSRFTQAESNEMNGFIGDYSVDSELTAASPAWEVLQVLYQNHRQTSDNENVYDDANGVSISNEDVEAVIRQLRDAEV